MLRRENIGHDLDEVAATLRHREILLNKPFLYKLYTSWYRGFIHHIPEDVQGQCLEIGSGGGFLKDLYPDIITSDIQAIPGCDRMFAAEELPFEPGSLKAIFMLNALHHIPDTESFLTKAEQALAPGGILYMVEPAVTPFSKWVYTRFHHEPFDVHAQQWSFPATGPMSGANDALPWIIFTRDRDRFLKLFPHLVVERIRLHTPFRYLLSGGFSYKSLLPGWAFGPVSVGEACLRPLFAWLALFQVIVVRKKITDGRK
ncbi:MAG: class I SAM-dependent methyltransferase [Flavobacteriales bacterium]|nr:class I SAM-dependent methyltransferase [Flavobacteriales bacterium]